MNIIAKIAVVCVAGGSDCRLWEYALFLAATFHAKLHILCVLPPLTGAGLDAIGGQPSLLPKVMSGGEQDAAKECAASAQEALAGSQVQGTFHTVTGSSIPQILSFVQEHEIDLVLVPRRNRPWWERLIDPGTLLALGRVAPCPIIIFPGTERHDPASPSSFTLKGTLA